MKEIALCIPTRNSAQTVDETLNEFAGLFGKFTVDLLYYDSSDTSDTMMVIDKYIKQGYNNIYYIPVSKSYSYGEKIDRIFGGKEISQYEYIWPIKDRVSPNDVMLKRVMDSCLDRPDIIFPVITNVNEGIYDMVSAGGFFAKYGVQATSLESVIYRRTTMLDGYIEGQIYEYNNRIWDFWQYFFVFSRLSQIDEPRIRIINENDSLFCEKNKNGSYWKDNILEVWVNNWLAVNDLLPDIYDKYKEDIVKRTASLENILGDRERLIQLHSKGILTRNSINAILDNWERVSDVPKEILVKIVTDEYDIFHDISIIHDSNDTIKLLKKMFALLQKGMPVSEIPIEELKSIIINEIIKQSKYSREVQILVVGCVGDICNYLRECNCKDALTFLQMLMIYIQEED